MANLIPLFVGALAVTAFLNGFFMSVMGLVQPPSDLPVYIEWAHYFSFQTWPFRAMAEYDIGQRTFLATDGTEVDGHEFLEGRELDVNIREAVAIMAGMAVFYRIVLYVILLRS